MNNSIIFRALLITTTVLGLPALAQAATLLEIYQQALQSDPRIHEAEARRLAARNADEPLRASSQKPAASEA